MAKAFVKSKPPPKPKSRAAKVADMYIAEDGGAPKKTEPKPEPATTFEPGPLSPAEPPRALRPVVVEPVAGPPAYEERFANLVLDAGARGSTYSDILLLMGITPSVAMLWRMCYPEFDAAFKEGQRLSDEVRTRAVEDALYERAKGFEYMSEKIITMGTEIRRVPTVERVHADVKAATYWLEGRDPERWKAKRQEVDVRLRVGRITDDMSPAEAAELFRSTLEGAVIEGELAAPTTTEDEDTEGIG